MSDLTQKTLETIKKYLLRQQKEVEEGIQEIVKDDPATSPALAESSEPGTDSWVADSHNRVLALGNRLGQRASSIKRALLRIRQGDYGICEKCKKPIEANRLLAMPTATFCLSCSKKTAK